MSNMNSKNEFNGLEITEINIKMVKFNSENPDQSLKAYARIVLNDIFIINSIKIVEGKFGMFISFPHEYDKNEGTGYNICFPITQNFHEHMAEKILTEYKLFQEKIKIA